MKNILVVTGTSENKRNFAVNYIESFMKDKGLTVSVEGKSIYDVTEVADGISAIVAIGQPQFTTDVLIIDTCCQQLLEKI